MGAGRTHRIDPRREGWVRGLCHIVIINCDNYNMTYETPSANAKARRHGSTRSVGVHTGDIFSPAWRTGPELSQADDEALGRPGRTGKGRTWRIRKSACSLHAARRATRPHSLPASP